MTDVPSGEVIGGFCLFTPRKTVPASKLGISLTISDEALREFKRLRDQQIRDMAQEPNYVWD